MNVKREIMFLRFARLLSHTQVVPLLRAHSVPPTHDLPLDLPHCVPSLPSTTRQPSCCTSWLGLGWRKKLSMFGFFMDSPWIEYRSRESPAGVVVEVLGIRILHLANLQCGRRRMMFVSGSGRSRNYSLCGEKKNKLDSIFGVIMEYKVQTPPCHGGSWRAPGYKSWANSSVKISTGFAKGCQSRQGNAGWWWQWFVTAELTNSGIGISEVCSLPDLDITGLAASPLTFPGGLACHGRSNQLVGGNVMSQLTGKMLFVGMISKSAPPSAVVGYTCGSEKI